MFILEINIGAKLNTKEVYEIICTKIINNLHDTIFLLANISNFTRNKCITVITFNFNNHLAKVSNYSFNYS